MPREMRKIFAADLLSDAEYEKRRRQLRAEAIAAKHNRRLEIGPFATFHFENYQTMWLQVQEMLRIEKGGAAQVEGELEAYNPLIPQGSELIATLMLEIEDPVRRAHLLKQLGGIEETIFMELGADRIQATPTEYDERTTPDGKTSSVHWLRFAFSVGQVECFRSGAEPIVIGINHPNYGHMAIMPDGMRRELSGDFR